ncbi:MAG TPA: hypothetical protein VLJ21_00545 [Candidatus Binatia bacterium]|nr:hypothetical protein [Candidatus Binatia bacterium]
MNVKYFVPVMLLILLSISVYAEETSDVPIYAGLDISDIIAICSSVLAAILGVISIIAYQRDRRGKLLFLTVAFFLFAAKGVLIIVSDVLLWEQFALDVIAGLLDFAVLLCFFASIMKR